MCKLLFATVQEGILVQNRNNKIFYFIHHACLENIFQKLIVAYSSSSFYLNDNLVVIAQRICCERFVNFIILAKQNRDINLLVFSFACFNGKAYLFQMRTHKCKHVIGFQMYISIFLFIHNFKTFDYFANSWCNPMRARKKLKIYHTFDAVNPYLF